MDQQARIEVLHARLDQQIEKVAELICADKSAHREIHLLTILTRLLTEGRERQMRQLPPSIARPKQSQELLDRADAAMNGPYSNIAGGIGAAPLEAT